MPHAGGSRQSVRKRALDTAAARRLLLLLDPRRHDFLLLNDLVHEILGRVEEWAPGTTVALNGAPVRQVAEVTARNRIHDALAGQRC